MKLVFKILRKKRYWLSFLLILVIFQLSSGCFTFRMSPKETQKFFDEHKVAATNYEYVVNERIINYVHTGDSTKPTVIFFHGAPGSWSAFKDFLVDDSLMTRLGIVSVDRPGYGYSDFGKSVASLKKQAELLKPILEKYSHTPNILVGHSLGGPVIAKLAMEYPQFVDGLVFVAPSIDPDLEPEEDWFRVPMRSPFLSWAIPTSFLVTNEEIYFLEDELRAMSSDWAKIKAPTIIIQGNDDKLVDPANAEYAQKMLVNSTFVQVIKEDNMNHFIPWTRPELIRTSILKLLEKEKG